MSTRGAIGFRLNGEDKLTYNHFDSYPGGLGEDFVKQVKELVKHPKILKTRVKKLKLVSKETGAPTPEDIKKLAPWTDLSVGGQATSDWYCLLRGTQGDLAETLKCGYMFYDNNFIYDSVFCEYAYILNLDDEKVEFYVGFQDKPHKKGRYGQISKDTDPKLTKYYGCALVGTYSMKRIPKNWHKVFPNE